MGEVRNIGSESRSDADSVLLKRAARLIRPIAYGICAYSSNAMLSSNPYSGIYLTETSRTLDLNGGNPACNQGGIVIVQYENDNN